MEGENEAPVVENEVEQLAPAPETPEPEKPHGNTGQTPWYMKRLAEEANKQREANERAAAAERRAAEAEALAARLRANPQDNKDPAPSQQQPQPRQEDRRAEISAEAARQRFYEDTGEVRSRGTAAYGASFSETLNILSALGATNDDFVSDVLAVDKANAHEMLKRISEDPEKAVALTQMSSRARIAELTRMHLAAERKEEPASAKPAPAAPSSKSSKAPPPAPHVTPSAAKVKDWRSDDASDAEFDAGFQDMMAKRSGRR